MERGSISFTKNKRKKNLHKSNRSFKYLKKINGWRKRKSIRLVLTLNKGFRHKPVLPNWLVLRKKISQKFSKPQASTSGLIQLYLYSRRNHWKFIVTEVFQISMTTLFREHAPEFHFTHFLITCHELKSQKFTFKSWAFSLSVNRTLRAVFSPLLFHWQSSLI